MNRRAFTLVEAIVVLGVIVLITAILLPTISTARAAAHRTGCLSNSRQVATLMVAFSTDNSGRLPENRTLVGPEQHVTWRHRFVEDGRMPAGDAWTCPAHPGEPTSEVGRPDHTTACVGDIPASYALNGHLLWREQINDDAARQPDGAIRRPNHTVLIAETRAPYPDLRVTNHLIALDDELGGFYGFWHAGKGTYAFIDGHAETIGLIDTGTPDCRWHNGRDLDDDPFDPQEREETRTHAHDDWVHLLHPVYLR